MIASVKCKVINSEKGEVRGEKKKCQVLSVKF